MPVGDIVKRQAMQLTNPLGQCEKKQETSLSGEILIQGQLKGLIRRMSWTTELETGFSPEAKPLSKDKTA